MTTQLSGSQLAELFDLDQIVVSPKHLPPPQEADPAVLSAVSAIAHEGGRGEWLLPVSADVVPAMKAQIHAAAAVLGKGATVRPIDLEDGTVKLVVSISDRRRGRKPGSTNGSAPNTESR